MLKLEADYRIRLQGACQDITVRKQAEVEKEKLIEELQDALAEVKTLRGYCRSVCTVK